MKRMYNWIHILRQAAVIGMMLVLFLSQTACTASGSKKGNAMVPGSSITPAPTVNKDIKGDGENPTFTGVLSLQDFSGFKMRFVDINSGTEYHGCGWHI